MKKIRLIRLNIAAIKQTLNSIYTGILYTVIACFIGLCISAAMLAFESLLINLNY